MNQREILLVEDNAADLELALRALARHKIANRIQIARDGAEALDCIFGSGGAPVAPGLKLVLLDLKLPKVSGLEVLRRIKEHSQTRTIPVVILTSSREEHDLKECYHLGANSYIVKPVNFERFSEAVRQLGLYWLLLNTLPGQ